MSLQNEPIPVEPVDPPEPLEPPEGGKTVESTVKNQVVGLIKIEQSAAVQNSLAGAVVAGQAAAVNDSACGVVVAGGNIQFTDSAGAVAVAGGNADITNSITGLLISPVSSVEQSTIGVLVAPQAALGKGVKVLMTMQQAIVFGAAFGAVAAILGRLLRRRYGGRG